MTSEAAFFDGGVLIRDGKIASVWSGSNVPTAHDGITVVATEGSIYPGLIDLHNHMHYNHIPLWDLKYTSHPHLVLKKAVTPIDISGATTGITARASLG